MTNHLRILFISLSLLSALPALPATDASVGKTAEADATGREALEYAFKFASAITADPKDMGKAQEAVALDMAATGDLEGATELARQVHDWRRGTALSEVAKLYALQGDSQRARELIDEAALVVPRTQGWPKLRVEAHVAEARAYLGDLEQAREAAVALARADAVQYIGRASTIVIVAHAASGELRKALELAETLDGNEDYEVSIWRTKAYVEIARRAEGDLRDEAIRKALESTGTVPGWRRAESLEEIARALKGLGRSEEARKAIQQAAEAVTTVKRGVPVKGHLLADVARTGSELGLSSSFRPYLETALKEAKEAMVIDRPGIHGNVASAYLALGDREEARRALDLALSEAAELVNARPRALSVVDICRYIGREGFSLDEGTRSRLDQLYGGLEAPW